MKKQLFTSSLIITLFFSGCGGGGSTSSSITSPGICYHNGTISTNATWSDNCTHVINGNLYIESTSGAILKIEANTTIKVNNGCAIYVGDSNPGGLIVKGTIDKPVTFTANSLSPPRGYWVGIIFGNQALTSSYISNATIAYAGGNSGYSLGDAAVIDDGDNINLKILNSKITESGDMGILFTGANGFAPSSTNNTITNCTGFPVSIPANFASTVEPGTYTGNGQNFILVNTQLGSGEGWKVTDNGTWENVGIPYYVNGDLYVDNNGNPPAPTLTIINSTIVIADDSIIKVGSDPGGLKAYNSTFTPVTKSKGAWKGIVFENDLTEGLLENCTVEYGGGDSGYTGYSNATDDDGNVIVIDNAVNNLNIYNSTIRESAAYGIIRGWDSTVTAGKDFTTASFNNTFTNNTLGDQSNPR
ncbi:hypothetical protein [Desulfurobacterium sp.]